MVDTHTARRAGRSVVSAGRFEFFSAVRGNSLSNHEPVEFFLPITRLTFFFFACIGRCVGDRVPVPFYLSDQESSINFFLRGSTTVEASFARLS